MEDFDGSGEPGSGDLPPRVLLIGFNTQHYRVWRKGAVAVVAWAHDEGRTVPEGCENVKMLPFHDVQFARFDPVRSATLDTGTAKRIADKARPLFQRTLLRLFDEGFLSIHSWLDVENRLNNAIHFYHDLLVRLQVDEVWMTSAPHIGTHLVLYEVARDMGLETRLGYQSILPGRFWIAKTIEDFDRFEEIEHENPKALVMPGAPEELFYMRNTDLRSGSYFRRHLATEATKILGKTVGLSFVYNAKSWRKNVLRLLRLQRDRRMYERILSLEPDYDPSAQFVYVPLHLQPELTTDILGGDYSDQLLMVEELREVLRDDVMIYVKENPKQNHFMREDSFFDRLSTMENVRLVPTSVPSLDLIANALAVATINGTAGWEALLMGKPALVFGLAWYATLPGAFPWPGPDENERRGVVDAALSFEFDRDALARAFEPLVRRTHDGLVDETYRELISEPDLSQEYEKAAQAFVDTALADRARAR